MSPARFYWRGGATREAKKRDRGREVESHAANARARARRRKKQAFVPVHRGPAEGDGPGTESAAPPWAHCGHRGLASPLAGARKLWVTNCRGSSEAGIVAWALAE